MQYWLNSNHPLWERVGVSQRDSEGRIRQILRYKIVTSALENQDQYERVWFGKKQFWIDSNYLEPLYPLSGGVEIPASMATERIEKQYITIDGRQKFNQCGQFCVMWCGGVGPEVFYPALKSKFSGLYAAHVTKDLVTSPTALVAFCNTLGLSCVYDHEALKVQSPRLIDEYMGVNQAALIAGVDIDPLGRIWSPSSGMRKIPHWIACVRGDDFANRLGDGLFTAYEPLRNGMIYDVRWTDIRPALFVQMRRREMVTNVLMQATIEAGV